MIKFYQSIRNSGISRTGAIFFIIISPVTYILSKFETPKRKAEYTYEELKAVHDNPHQPTAEEIKNTFIEDDEKVDISKLKL